MTSLESFVFRRVVDDQYVHLIAIQKAGRNSLQDVFDGAFSVVRDYKDQDTAFFHLEVGMIVRSTQLNLGDRLYV